MAGLCIAIASIYSLMKNIDVNRNLQSIENPGRRRFLNLGLAATATLLSGTAFGRAGSGEKALAFHNLHTGEKLRATYWANGRYLDEGMMLINEVLRDHRTNEAIDFSYELMDLLHAMQLQLGTKKPFHVVSGYRSPKTNAMLRRTSSGVAKRSFHMQGQAIDIRMPGASLQNVHKAALALRGGGVGYYPGSNFIHLDVGPVRHWRGK